MRMPMAGSSLVVEQSIFRQNCRFRWRNYLISTTITGSRFGYISLDEETELLDLDANGEGLDEQGASILLSL
jgi:hypothetical protein